MKAKGIAWKKDKASKTKSTTPTPGSESEDEEHPEGSSPPVKKRKLQADGTRSASSDANPRQPKRSTEAPESAHAPTETTENPAKTKKSRAEQGRRKTAAKSSSQQPPDASLRPSKPLKNAHSVIASQQPSRSSTGTKVLPDGKKRKRPHKEAV